MEYKINDHITLRLEDGLTNIYINKKLFRQCKYLILEVSLNEMKITRDIDSIDEAQEKLKHSEHLYWEHKSLIPPETEFWGHCSNIQAWVENDYDTRILHSNLAFPLLRELAEAGDPIARNVFKKEIIKRIESSYPNVIEFLLTGGFADYFNTQQIDQIVKKIDFKKLLNTNMNLGLIILRDLSNLGGEKAKFLFIQAIAIGIENGSEAEINYIFNHGYLDYLNKDQKTIVLNVLEKKINSLNLKEYKDFIVGLLRHVGWINNILYRYDESIKAYKRALEIDPLNETILNSLGVSYNEKGDYIKALKSFKKAIENSQHQPDQKNIFNNLGWTYCNLGDYDKAIQACLKAINIDPKYANPWNHMGYAFYKKGEIESAISMIKTSLKFKPNYSRALYYLAKIYYEMGNLEKALDTCKKCSEIITSTENIYYKSSFDLKKCTELQNAIVNVNCNIT